MTCIIGLEEGGKAYVGADSMQIEGLDNAISTNKKIFRRNGFIFAHTGQCRGTQIMKYLIDIPLIDDTDEEFIFKHISEPLRMKMKEIGYSEIKDNIEMHRDRWIVAHKNKVYLINSDWEVARKANGLAVGGCGGDYATGAMFALKNILPPKKRIERALKISAKCSVGVGPPFVIWETEK